MAKVKGMVVEIGGDTSALQQALKQAEKTTNSLQRELKELNKDLKIDPSNFTFASQKSQVLGESIKNNKEYLKSLEEEQARYIEQGGDLNAPAYRNLQRQIELTKDKIAELTAQTSVFTKIGENFQSVGTFLKKSGDETKNVSKNIADLGSSIAGVGAKITALSAGIVAGLGSAVSRYDTIKNYPKVLSNLGFSSEDAKKSIDELSKGIDGLPTSLDSAASGVQRLVAKNSDINKSTKYFLAMNDAIVAGNAPAEQQASAIEQLTQSYSKGKPDLMEWRTLMMAMPGQLKQVANAMGYVDTDSLYEGFKNGSVSMDKFMDTLVKLDTEGVDGFQSFSEQAHNSCDSVGTAVVNLANRIKKGFATILENLDNVAKNTSFGSIAGMINNFSTAIKNLLDKIGKGISQNKSAQALIDNIGKSLEKINNAVNNLNAEQIDNIVNALVKLVEAGPGLLVAGKALNIVGKAGESLGNFQSAIGGVFQTLGNANEKIGEGMGALTKIGPIFDGLGNKIKNSGFATNISMLGTLVKTQVQDIGLTIGNGFSSLFPMISENLGKIGEGISSFFGKLGPIILSAGPTIIQAFATAFNITAIAGILAAGLGKIQEMFGEQIQNWASTIEAQGPTIITNFCNGIVNSINQLIPLGAQLINTLLQALIANLPAIITGGINIVSSLVEGIAKQLPTLVQTAINLIITIGNTLIQNLPTIIKAGMDLLVGLIQGLTNAIPQLIQWLPTIIRTILTAIISSLPQIINAGIKVIIALITGLIQAIPQLIKSIPQIIAAIVGAFRDSWPEIKQAGAELLGMVGNGIKSRLSEAGSWGKDMLDGFIQGMKSKLGQLKDTVANIGNTIKSFLHFSRPDIGPLRNYEKWMPDMIEGLASSLKSSAPLLYKETENVASMLKSGLTSGLNNINVAGNPALAGASSGNSNINVTFNVQKMSDAELDRAYNYINRKWGKIF